MTAFDATAARPEKDESPNKTTDNQANISVENQAGVAQLTPKTGLEKAPQQLNTDTTSLYASVHSDPKVDAVAGGAKRPSEQTESYQPPMMLAVQERSYHDQMHANLNDLNEALKSGNQKNIDEALKPVEQDVKWWSKQSDLNTDVQKNLVESMKSLQSGDKNAFDSVQNDLTTLETQYWINHHGGTTGSGASDSGDSGGHGSGGGGDSGGSGSGSGSGTGGDGSGSKAPPGAHVFNNLDSSPWTITLGKGSQQHGIGGSGDVQSASYTPTGSDTATYSTTGGAWGDSLAARHIAISPTDNHFQLNATFNLDSNYIKYGAMVEKDMVVSENGKQATIGTQLDPTNGNVYFWNQETYLQGKKGAWVLEGSVTGGKPLEAGVNYNLQIDAHTSGGQYIYDSYSLNGQQVPMKQVAFSKTSTDWSNGMVDQSQQDLNGKAPDGTTISATWSNDQITSWEQ
jgi:hypothetical protein